MTVDDANSLKARLSSRHVEAGVLDVKLSASELGQRRQSWIAKASEFTSGYPWKHAEQVGPAFGGVITHPGGAAEPKRYGDI
jgi:dihydroxy-acid dehydratase